MKVFKQLPELVHIWLPIFVAAIIVYTTPFIDPLAAQLDIYPYVQACILALCILLFNNLFVNLGIKYNFKAEWNQYVQSLEGSQYASWQFYCLWAFLHVVIGLIEAAVVL